MYPGSFQGTQSQFLGSFRQALSERPEKLEIDRVPSMQVIWACVHENFSACNLSISNHVTGWNTLSSTSMYTVRPLTIHVHVWSYYAALLVKPVTNVGILDQFYQTIHRLERSLSSTSIPYPTQNMNKPYNWRRNDKPKCRKKTWIFCFWHRL